MDTPSWVSGLVPIAEAQIKLQRVKSLRCFLLYGIRISSATHKTFYWKKEQSDPVINKVDTRAATNKLVRLANETPP